MVTMQNSNTLLLLCLRDLHSVTSHVTTAERSHVMMEAPMTRVFSNKVLFKVPAVFRHDAAACVQMRAECKPSLHLHLEPDTVT